MLFLYFAEDVSVSGREYYVLLIQILELSNQNFVGNIPVSYFLFPDMIHNQIAYPLNLATAIPYRDLPENTSD